MQDFRLKAFSVILISSLFLVNPAAAVDVMDESILDESFNQQFYVESARKADVAALHSSSEELAEHLDSLEKDLQIILATIEEVNKEIENFKPSEEELNKTASYKNVDVAEKEVYKGVSYDKDIFDHGKELAEHDSGTFYNEYLDL